MDAGVLQPLIDILVKVHIWIKSKWNNVVFIISFCFRATSKPRKRRHGRSPTWPAVERYYDIRIAFDRKTTRLLCRCLKLSTCAVRAFSSPSATCSPPRMTKRSASFSTNCPDQYLQVGVVLDGVSNILATAEKLAEVDKVTRNILHFH